MKSEFGRFLRERRKQMGLTLQSLAKLSGVSQTYLTNIENGKRGIPSPEILNKLADPLEISYKELMEKAGYLPREATQEDIDAFFNDVGTARITFEVPCYEYEYDNNGAKVQTLIPPEELRRRFFDIGYLFTNRDEAYYNGHRLTAEEKRRALDMLKLLFPEYAPKE